MEKPDKPPEPRAKYVSAWIVTNGRADRECQVLDISPTGAKVIVPVGSEIPDRFSLAYFQDADKRQNCEVIWRRAKMLGVRFTS